MFDNSNIKINLEGDILVAIIQLQAQMADLYAQVGKIDQRIDKAGKDAKDSFGVIMAAGINQALELVDRLSDSLSFTTEIQNLQVEIQRFTQMTGDDLESATSKAYRLAEVFDEDATKIVRAANAMTDQIGGTFEENLNLIQQGFEKGANLNGDMLDQLAEYAPHLKQAGLSGAQGLAIMAQAAEKGVFSDKPLDSIKEGGFALREMGKAQIDALAGIGLEAKDLAGKTTYEALQIVTGAMDGFSTQAKQLVLADIFKGAGEDAGLSFITGLSTMELDLTQVPSVAQAGEDVKGFFADVKSWIGMTLGDMMPYVTTIAQIGSGIAGLMPLMKIFGDWFKKTKLYTWLAAQAQVAYNLALSLNPIGIVIIAIGALVAAIAWLTDGFSGFGDYFYAFWDTLTGWFSDLVSFWVKYLNPFAWLYHLIDYLFPETGEKIRKWFDELWNWITGWVDDIVGAVTGAFDSVADFFGFGEDGDIEVKANGSIKMVNDMLNVDNYQKTPDPKDLKPDPNDPALKYDPMMPVGVPKSKQTNAPTKSSGQKKDAGFASAEKKEINTRIEALVKQVNIHVPEVSMSTAKIRQLIEEALVGAVRDFEVAIN